jgi:hypothetical protein
MKPPPILYNGRYYYQNSRGYWVSGSAPGPKPLHRAVWEDAHGPIPEGHHIHHRDRNPSNNTLENLELIEGKSHISLHKKGVTHPGLRGESCPTVRLTEAQVLEIRATYVRGRNGGQRALAEKYGVNQGTISFALSGRTWSHLDGAARPPLAAYCPKGHEYTPETLKVLNSGARRCRICFNATRSLTRARQRQKRREERLNARQATA